jgi:thioredoxin 1
MVSCIMLLSNTHGGIMAGGSIKEIFEQSFYDEIKKGLVLVDFSAEWCGPCRMLAPVLEKVSKELQGVATIAKLDIDNAQKIAASFRVTSVPTLILFEDGKEVDRLVGLRDQAAIKQFVTSKAKS